jgi:adenylylsulfate kinase
MKALFALWLTGLPACGKSAIARELLVQLHARGTDAALLESDVMRKQLTPFPRYDAAERDFFYGCLGDIAVVLLQRGVPVVLDATANKRSYRVALRARVGNFAEIFVDTPPEICAARDPKGLYRAARQGSVSSLPGSQAAYEPPAAPELIVPGHGTTPAAAAREIFALLERRSWM